MSKPNNHIEIFQGNGKNLFHDSWISLWTLKIRKVRDRGLFGEGWWWVVFRVSSFHIISPYSHTLQKWGGMADSSHRQQWLEDPFMTLPNLHLTTQKSMTFYPTFSSTLLHSGSDCHHVWRLSQTSWLPAHCLYIGLHLTKYYSWHLLRWPGKHRR